MFQRLFVLFLFSISISAQAFLGMFAKDRVNRYVYVSIKMSKFMAPIDENDEVVWNENVQLKLVNEANDLLQKNCEEVYEGVYQDDIFAIKRIGILEEGRDVYYILSARAHCKEPFDNPKGRLQAAGATIADALKVHDEPKEEVEPDSESFE